MHVECSWLGFNIGAVDTDKKFEEYTHIKSIISSVVFY